jgi:hypothetical protein
LLKYEFVTSLDDILQSQKGAIYIASKIEGIRTQRDRMQISAH